MVTEQASTGTTVEAVSAQVRTFLIADVRGYTRFTLERGDEAAAKLASRFAELASEVVASREGEVIELRGDEALAVFTSARQALRASIDLQDRFLHESQNSSLPFRVGVGLDSGEAIAVAGGYRGAALNLASRLCALAGAGEVLASDTVANLARKIEGVEYSERGSVQLKGFAADVRVVEVRAASTVGYVTDNVRQASDVAIVRERPLPIGGFLGALPGGMLVSRQDELGTILSAVEAVAGGTGRLLLLAGEPGAGKTRLAQEVTLNVRNRGFVLATGTCYEARQTVPYYPFLDVLASLYGSCSSTLRSVTRERWAFMGRLLPEAGINGPTASSDAQEEQERLFRAVTGFVQAIAEESPIAILLDDLHWADSSSLDLLQHLARQTRAHRVLLLGTYRDVEVGRQHPLGQALQNLGRQRLVERIHIRRMEQEGTAALIADSFGQEEISPEFAQLVHRHTEGNPFFTQEVLRSLIERGDIYREDGRWERREIDEIEVPESVRDTIGARLSRLSEEAQEILRAASVIGQTFAFDDLQAMGNHGEEELEAALEEAIAAALIRERGPEEYGFSHALVQQTLDSELSLRRKRRLHLAAGEALERLPQSARERRAPELAWHFLQADDTQRALAYALLAGDQAEAVFAHGEAEAQYRAAVELAQDMNDDALKARAQESLGGVLRIIGKYDEALEVIENAVHLFQQTENREAEQLALAAIGSIHAERGSAQEGIGRLQEALARYGQAPPSRGLAAIYVSLSYLFFFTGRVQDELEAASQAADLARTMGEDQLLVRAELRRGTALSVLKSPAASIAVLEPVLPLAEQVADLTTEASLFNNLAFDYFRQGDFERNREYRQRALLLQERRGDPMYVAFGTAMLAQALYFLGDWDQAVEQAKRAHDMTAPLGSASRVAHVKLQLAQILLGKGARYEADALLRESMKIAEANSDLQALTWATSMLAELAVGDEEYRDTIRRIEAILEQCRRENSYIAWTCWPLAYLMLESGETERAEQLVEEALQVAVKEGDEWTRGEALRVRGTVLAHKSKWDAAAATFQEAVVLARSFPYPYAEARGLHQWGCMYMQKGDVQEGRVRLQEALNIFQRLGAKKDIERTEEALERLDTHKHVGSLAALNT